MKKILICLCVAITFNVAAVAQTLDPTVEVSREYEGKLIEVHKPYMDMAVPDSLHNFDLGFDYSVFESPYKGSYEFNPYMVQMRPAPSGSVGNVFYLNAGAGYTLHPTLDLLWSPMKKGAFSVDAYGMYRSYIGTYRGLWQDDWSGYDMLSKAGVDLGYDWEKVAVDFGVSYNGIHDKDYRRTRGYNSIDAYAALKSKTSMSKSFMYDVSASYRFIDDAYKVSASGVLSGHEFALDSRIGPIFLSTGNLIFDLGLETDSYSNVYDATMSRFYLVPRYLYEKGIMKLNAGLRISGVVTSENVAATRGQIVYPDVRADFFLVPDAMKLYLHIGGGDKLNRYSSLIADNHHLDLSYGVSGRLMDVSVERVSAVLGLEGRISSCFSYNFRGGYVNYKNTLFDVAYTDGSGVYVPGVGYAACQKSFVALDWNLDISPVRFFGALESTRAWGIADPAMIGPALLKGDMAAEYSWMKRLDAGLDCEFSLSRASSAGFVVPGYADLGIFAEYAMNRKLSFWLRGGNLLNMEIQRNLLYAEKGINFTAGICLTL